MNEISTKIMQPYLYGYRNCMMTNDRSYEESSETFGTERV